MDKKLLLSTLLVTLFLGLLSSVYFLPSSNNTAHAATEHCPDGGVKTNASFDGQFDNVVLASGTSFCVKGSTDATGILTANGTTTLFQYLNNGHNVSYFVIYTTPTNTPTPTPTKTPTPTVTPTPTMTPTPTLTNTPTPTPTLTNTPTPTPTSICVSNASCNTGSTNTPTPTPNSEVTATPTPTQEASSSATPTPTTTSSSGSTQSSSSTSTPQVQPATAVLSASTMAPTGTFITTLMNSLMSLGVLSLSLGSLLYAKTKKA